MRVWQAAWDGNNVWDTEATPNRDLMDFQLPDELDPRKLQFKFHSTNPSTGQDTWEPDDFIRRLFLLSPTEVWTFDSSPRILYRNPFPAGIVFHAGDVLTFQVITQKDSEGGSSTLGILTIRVLHQLISQKRRATMSTLSPHSA
jgi:hypothetical protein